MSQKTTIPQTPEEVALCLSQLTEVEQGVVKGFILGFHEKGTEAHNES